MNPDILAQLSGVMNAQATNNTIVNLPENSPFDPEQRQWLSGLLTGISTLTAAAAAGPQEPPTGAPLHILYGSQSGNSEVLAKDLKKHGLAQGFEATIAELDSLSVDELCQMDHLLIVCSTFGDGDPPDNAKNFYTQLMGDDAPQLPPSLNFSVCGLGDSSYTHFNKCAKDIEARLRQLGGTPTTDFMSCDAAFEDDYATWKGSVFSSEAFSNAAGSAPMISPGEEEKEQSYHKNKPFVANLIKSTRLSDPSSSKCVNHIEISLAGGAEDMRYEVGDALGVWPLNCAEEVEEILSCAGLCGNEVVSLKSGPASLRILMLTKLDIHTVNAKTIEAWNIPSPPEGAQVIDVLSELNKKLEAQTFAEGLRPLQPRLYSIASSSKAHPGEVHLTVGEVHYQSLGRQRKGVASTWLGERLPEASNLAVYIQPSAHFHIPAQDDAPLIMIGPGTGIAPFRAFLEERQMREATGKNWLFFGDQHEASDYLYRDEIMAWQASGLLTKLSLAWSRDTSEKIYVQTKIREQGQEFFRWLEAGAHIYICGDASRMAADVDQAIRDVIGEHGDLDDTAVSSYMELLVKEHRYQRDVY